MCTQTQGKGRLAHPEMPCGQCRRLDAMKLFDRAVRPVRGHLYCNLCGEPGEFGSAIFWCKDCKMYVHLGDVVEAKVVKEVGQGFSTPDAEYAIFRTLECGHVIERQQVSEHPAA